MEEEVEVPPSPPPEYMSRVRSMMDDAKVVIIMGKPYTCYTSTTVSYDYLDFMTN